MTTPQPTSKRIGILGGTFDPVHLGHLAAARVARHCGAIDHVLMVPSNEPPHRPAPVASARHRLEMCRLAAIDEPNLDVWDIESVREGPSYSLDTILALREGRPFDDIFLILGWDAARQIRTWHRPDEVLELAQLLIVRRPGETPPTPEDLVAAGIPPERAIVCHDRTPDISSTRIREVAQQMARLDGLVPASVAEYMWEFSIYRGDWINRDRA